MGTKQQGGLSILNLMGIVSTLFCPTLVLANSAQTSLDLGLNFFQKDSADLLPQNGYFIHFQFEMKGAWIRPTFGTLIEFASSANRILSGHMQGGFELVASRANYVKPFLGVNGDMAWINFSSNSSTYNALVYGVQISAGTEIRFKEDDSKSGIRLSTMYRYLVGNVGGGLNASNLNAVSFSVGILF